MHTDGESFGEDIIHLNENGRVSVEHKSGNGYVLDFIFKFELDKLTVQFKQSIDFESGLWKRAVFTGDREISTVEKTLTIMEGNIFYTPTFDEGYTEGYTSGYENGYNDGLVEGVASSVEDLTV